MHVIDKIKEVLQRIAEDGKVVDAIYLNSEDYKEWLMILNRLNPNDVVLDTCKFGHSRVLGEYIIPMTTFEYLLYDNRSFVATVTSYFITKELDKATIVPGEVYHLNV